MMKVKPVKLGKTERMSFSHIDEVISMPNLIEGTPESISGLMPCSCKACIIPKWANPFINPPLRA